MIQTITPITDEAGEVRSFVAVHENVTELRVSQARLQALFDPALDGFLLYDDTGRLVDANPAVSALSGYTREQLMQMSMVDIVPAEFLEEYAAIWDTLRAEGATRAIVPLVHADGHVVEVEVQSVADILPDIHLSVLRDVTEQRRLQAAERSQAQLLEAVGEAVIATDLDGTVRYWNPAAQALYGWSSEHALGRSIMDLTPSQASQEQAAEIMAHLQAGETWAGRFETTAADGRTFPAWVSDAPYYNDQGQLAGIIGVSSDISELETARERLAHRVDQQAAVASLGQYALQSHDPRAVGVEAENQISALLDPDLRVRVHWSPHTSHHLAPVEDGTVLQIPISTAGTLVVDGDDPDRLDADDEQFLRTMAHVISTAVRAQTATAELEHLATHDQLTGLPNRTLFLDRLTHAAAAAIRTQRPYAVLFLDLDGFKHINDGLGHESGDEVLQLTVSRLRAAVRPADTIARFGGDEFAILCPDLNQGGATEVANRIQAALASPFDTGHGELGVTASIGIVLGDAHSEPTRLLRDADAAMYAAKDNGRNRVEHFTDAMYQHAQQRLVTVNQLRDALADDGVVVHYQPTIELATGRLVGVEALVRLRLPDGNLLPPGAFINIAEDAGLIEALGQRVLEIACADAAGWISDQPDFTLAVNVSPRQFTSPHLGKTITHILEHAGIPPTNLWLEITESTLLTGLHVHTAICAMRLSGINFAIDDFGTGYSSLAHLRDTPVDALKIDRRFVAGITDNPRDRALVVAALDLAHTFELTTVAEGIETDQQRQQLTVLGCDLAHGYLWSPPVPAESVTGMLQQGDLLGPGDTQP